MFDRGAERRSRSISKLRGTPAWAETEEGRADALYAPYVERQQREWEVGRSATRACWIPADLDYARGPGLSNEMVERLERVAAGDARPGVARFRA